MENIIKLDRGLLTIVSLDKLALVYIDGWQ